jgi:hypothetical protein
MLCMRPETWAEAARYPGWVTLLPLLVALILASFVTAAGATFRMQSALHAFATGYDGAGYPPLEYHSDGTLSVKGELANPIRFELPEGVVVLIDPSGKTTPESVKSQALLVTNSQILATGEEGSVPLINLTSLRPLVNFDASAPGTTAKIIDTSSMLGFLNNHRIEMVISSMSSAVIVFLLEALWAVAMIYLASPLVMLAASGGHLSAASRERRLLLPRAAAARMVAAFLVPMVLLNAILHASGHSTTSLLGAEGSLLFWFLACGGLAVWTGFLAKQLFMPKEPVRQGK